MPCLSKRMVSQLVVGLGLIISPPAFADNSLLLETKVTFSNESDRREILFFRMRDVGIRHAQQLIHGEHKAAFQLLGVSVVDAGETPALKMSLDISLGIDSNHKYQGGFIPDYSNPSLGGRAVITSSGGRVVLEQNCIGLLDLDWRYQR